MKRDREKGRGLVYLLYGIPGIFLSIWLEFLFGGQRPDWLAPVQLLLTAVPLILASYICGRRRWVRTILLGNVLNYLSSWVFLAVADGVYGMSGIDGLRHYYPDSFHRQLLTLLFLLELCGQLGCWFLGRRRPVKKRVEACRERVRRDGGLGGFASKLLRPTAGEMQAPPGLRRLVWILYAAPTAFLAAWVSGRYSGGVFLGLLIALPPAAALGFVCGKWKARRILWGGEGLNLLASLLCALLVSPVYQACLAFFLISLYTGWLFFLFEGGTREAREQPPA